MRWSQQAVWKRDECCKRGSDLWLVQLSSPRVIMAILNVGGTVADVDYIYMRFVDKKLFLMSTLSTIQCF